MNVDHGSGLERYAAALRNDADMFNIDVFDEPKNMIEKLSGKKYGVDEKEIYAYRVVLDHIRSATFLISDGVMPGNKDQMYFVRRLIRRAVRFARNLGVTTNFTKDVASSFIETYKGQYKNLGEKREIILNEIDKEESKFRATLETGIKEFDKKTRDILMDDVEATSADGFKERILPAQTAFDLLQNHGFPIELIEELCKEKNIAINLMEFKKLKDAHSEASRTASAGKFKGGLGGNGEMETKYHTATHMLHQALREVLGKTVEQKGSNITPERLRFDFSFERKMTDEEKKQVEDIINARIKEALPVIREEVSMEEARARGAIGLFGDKYGDVVCIYRVGEGKKRGDTDLFSMEFCGGPHIANTHELAVTIGPDGTLLEDVFKIVKEEAVSSGVRRIKAVLQ